MRKRAKRCDARSRLILIATSLFRERGYCATSLKDLCNLAGLKRGGFYYHFKSKESLAIAALEHFAMIEGTAFAHADFHKLPDPYQRLVGYISYKSSLKIGTGAESSCLAGTLLQEIHQTHPMIRSACAVVIDAQAELILPLVKAAKKQHVPTADWRPSALTQHIQSVFQGCDIIAKAKQKSLAGTREHLSVYLASLFCQSAGSLGGKAGDRSRPPCDFSEASSL